MSGSLFLLLELTAALGCGLMAGVFFAFSTFVMKALARLPASQAVAAMQAINAVAVTPVFMSAFLGTGAVCAVLAVCALLSWQRPGSGWLLAGSLLYLAGAIGVTAVCNVPRNEALAAVETTSPSAAMAWQHFARGWTLWNHVRTVAALCAAALLTIALTG